MEVSLRSSDGDKILIPSKPNLIYENDSEGDDDLMVSGTIAPLTIPVDMLVPHSGARLPSQ